LGHYYDVGVENKFFVERKYLLFESVGKKMIVDGNEELVMLQNIKKHYRLLRLNRVA